MNAKNLTLAALFAALCAMPAVAAEPGPDVTVTYDTRPTVSCATTPVSYTIGPVTVAADDCVFTFDYDGNNFVAICHPFSTPPIVQAQVAVGWDCHVYVYA